jgi:hypothetical protein
LAYGSATAQGQPRGAPSARQDFRRHARIGDLRPPARPRACRSLCCRGSYTPQWRHRTGRLLSRRAYELWLGCRRALGTSPARGRVVVCQRGRALRRRPREDDRRADWWRGTLLWRHLPPLEGSRGQYPTRSRAPADARRSRIGWKLQLWRFGVAAGKARRRCSRKAWQPATLRATALKERGKGRAV